MSIENWTDFQNRVKRQKMLPIPAQKRETSTANNSGVEIPAEILAETELYKARRTLEYLESKKQTETPVVDDENEDSGWSIYDTPLNVELNNNDFDYIEAKNLTENDDFNDDDSDEDF